MEALPEFWRLRSIFRQADRTGLRNPYFCCHEGVAADTTVVGGRQVVNFATYNYLGMSGDPEVSTAAQEAIARFGTSVSASRLISGEKCLHRDLECQLANFLGTEDAVVFVSGHATNVSTIGHILGPEDLVLHDVLAHDSIVQGCRLSGACRHAFPHNDWQACGKLLQRLRNDFRNVLIAIEGVYSMDGDFPDLPAFVALRNQHGALLLVDEAHSLGTMGASGRGLAEHFQVDRGDVDLWMGTLSKSLGSCGGYIAGSRDVVEYLKYTASGFVFSVGISPANAAAALASLRLLQRQPSRVAKLAENVKLFHREARLARLDVGRSGGTPIVPLILRDARRVLMLAERLLQRGINVAPILPPAVSERAARLRFFITCQHSEQHIRETVAAVAAELGTPTPNTPHAA